MKERAGRGVDGSAEEIVGSGVADVELDGGIERDQLHQVGLEKISLLDGRLGFEGFGAEFVDRVDRGDVKADSLREAGLQYRKKKAEE